MTLAFASILSSTGINPAETLSIRHAYVPMHADRTPGIHADSSDTELLNYTRVHSVKAPRTVCHEVVGRERAARVGKTHAPRRSSRSRLARSGREIMRAHQPALNID